MIDLHTHSTCSDGTYTPTSLVELATQIGITALALTDHDTVAGVSEASRACARRGIQFIAGVELEVDYNAGEFHVLGLGMTATPETIEAELAEMKRRRHHRNLGIIRKMTEDGLDVDLQTVGSFSDGEVLGRPHFARFLVQRGLAHSIQDAFDRFLGRDRKYYQAIEHLTIEDCSRIIRRAGGRTIIAHPHSLRLSLDELDRRLPAWKELGVEGIETMHTNAPIELCREFELLARRHGLIPTAGSDFHGSNRTDRTLGRSSGGFEIGERYLEELL